MLSSGSYESAIPTASCVTRITLGDPATPLASTVMLALLAEPVSFAEAVIVKLPGVEPPAEDTSIHVTSSETL